MATEKNGAKKRSKKKSESQSDPAVSYDEFKEFEGKKYTGMKIGRTHKWYYDKGEWKEKKVTPDLWTISYAVNKRRAGRAPEGSGVPVGTEYHWYVLAHQNVKKLNANDYTTSMAGVKFKVAHKRADSEKWSATEKTQRKRMIQFLKDMIEELEAQQAEEEKGKSAEAEAAKAEGRKAAAVKPPDRHEAASEEKSKRSVRKPSRAAGRVSTPKSVSKLSRPRRKPVG